MPRNFPKTLLKNSLFQRPVSFEFTVSFKFSVALELNLGIQCDSIGRSRGGAASMPPPPNRINFFCFRIRFCQNVYASQAPTSNMYTFRQKHMRKRKKLILLRGGAPAAPPGSGNVEYSNHDFLRSKNYTRTAEGPCLTYFQDGSGNDWGWPWPSFSISPSGLDLLLILFLTKMLAMSNFFNCYSVPTS